MTTGSKILELALRHLGEPYDFVTVPKNDPNWKGPWDCAELVSWCVYQAAGILYGCDNNQGNPAKADAYTGYWARDARTLGKTVPAAVAARIPGAAVLRVPGGTGPKPMGHIVISDGKGGTVEAHSRNRGVIRHTLSGRRWDMGILVPGISYEESALSLDLEPPPTIYRLTSPYMTGEAVRRIQERLQALGFDPGPADGIFGPMTFSAVLAFQKARGLVPDGEVGPETARALGITLE